MSSTDRKRKVKSWIVAVMLALSLLGAPALSGTAAADCTSSCSGTTSG